MAMSMLQLQEKNTWQVVKSKAEDKKKKQDESKNKKKETKKDRLGVPVDPAKVAFAAFDMPDFVMGGAKKTAPQPQGATPYVGTFTGLQLEALPTFYEEPTNPATPPNADENKTLASPDGSDAHGPTTKGKKPKALKPKKPKVTITSVAEALNLAQLEALLATLADKYRSNEVSQVEMLADHLLKLFKDVELPFNNILLEKSQGKASEVIYSELPDPFVELLSGFLGQKSVEALGPVVASLVVAIVEGLQESAKAKTGVQPPKAKVGILVVLSILLRTCPAALVQAAPGLLAAGRQLTAPGRLPHFIWVVSQAASVSPSSAVATLVRVLIPQMLGGDLLAALTPTPAVAKKDPSAAGPEARGLLPTMDSSSQPAALEYLSLLLCGSAEGTSLHGDVAQHPDVTAQDGQVLTAVIPPLVLESIVRVVQLEVLAAPVAKATRSRLAALYTCLYQLAGSSAAPRQLLDWLPLALETAGMSQAPYEGAGDDLVVHASSSVLACLSRDDASFGVWETKHKSMVKGSARVLQHLLTRRPPALRRLLSSAQKRQLFQSTLGTLQKRHIFHLTQGKGAHRTAARAAQDACQRLLSGAGATSRSAAGAGGVASALPALLLLTSGAAAGILAAAYHRQQVQAFLQQHAGVEAAQQVDSVLAAIHGAAAPYVQQAWEAGQPAVLAALAQLQHLRTVAEPLAAQLKELLERMKEQAAALLKSAQA